MEQAGQKEGKISGEKRLNSEVCLSAEGFNRVFLFMRKIIFRKIPEVKLGNNFNKKE
ncbi:MAG: hypothetical protein H6563_11680 [Lewinellaceae bacterium]|nr:hypothetical protein [Lewinellaceae bacterium]